MKINLKSFFTPSQPTAGTPPPQAQAQEITALRSQVAERDSEIAKLQAEVADLKRQLAAADDALELRANIKAMETIARAGHRPLNISDNGSMHGGSLAQIRAQIEREKDPVKKGELAKQARELRGHSNLFEVKPQAHES